MQRPIDRTGRRAAHPANRAEQDEIARYGISARQVLDVVESISSKVIGEVVEGQLRFPLVARLPDQYRENPEVIGRILLSGPGGEQLPLSVSRTSDVSVVLR